MAAVQGAALDAATEAAVGWLVTLNSGEVSASERQGFEHWLQADARHRSAWEQLHGPLQQMLSPLRPGTAGRMGEAMSEAMGRAEARARRRRSLLRGALGLGGMALGAGFVAHRHAPIHQWTADLRTGTGERCEFALPDGSTVTLDARSAADLDFSGGRRNVFLRQGAVLAHAAPRAWVVGQGGDAFTVRTAHGRVRALGTRFVVRQDADSTLVSMLEHSVRITTTEGHSQVLQQGRSARFGRAGIAEDPTDPATASAWQRGMLEAHDLPLGEVVQALRPYRAGFIRVAPRAAALHVYGTFSLDDTDRALAALAETLPIAVKVYQRGWLVTIE
ncbi:fec operon regulator FecR [Delftia tsuruhatensis]|uniref:FecR family protein n=1 Tax=Delftia tsuruhatensis TaxID=180282 RepID=UPI001E7B7E4E|nr:FecR domain-containing protein [Delftia tsuruhatensis]CAB5714720.1 fec operon regulator FecR [Delftia tsuruhatensis]CAC9689187.1 fec operon regulator FecR [Delftia tsuruhatensis]